MISANAKVVASLFPAIREVINWSVPFNFPECKGKCCFHFIWGWVLELEPRYDDIVLERQLLICLSILDWTPVTVHPRVVQVVSGVSTRVFVGNDMEKNAEWMEISSNVSTSANIESSRQLHTNITTY